MDPDRRSLQPTEQTNLQQQNVLQDRPHPLLTANDGNPPPPVPPRVPQSSYPSTGLSGTGMFGYPMNPYTMNQGYNYGGFMPGYANPMLGTGGLGGPMGGMEDVGRSVFETVGGVVQTLSSVSMMLQSTLYAVQNSVQAVLSVAHQFGHLRNHIIEMCIATIRIVKHYYRKLLYLFRLKKGASADALWSEAAAQHATSQNGRGILLCFAVVLGVPYFMWNIVKSILAADTNQWVRGRGEHYVAEVNYDYKATKNDELSVRCGDRIYIAPKHKQPPVKGWILASFNDRKGIVPANYVKVVGKGEPQTNNTNSDCESVSTNSNLDDKIVDVTTPCVTESCDVKK